MGCDGGTIPRRDELVRLKKKAEQKDKVSELSFRWQHCNVSQEPLKKPIVACALGRLYNKDTIIEKLLDKTTLPETISHVKGLKDIRDLNLAPNPAYKDEVEKGDNQRDHQTAPHICPISGLEMNGKFKFCFFWTCGCVLSERALKQFNEKNCPTCQKSYSNLDVVILNAVDEDLQKNILNRDERLEIQKANKKSKTKFKVEPKTEKEETKVLTSKKDIKNVKIEPSSSKLDGKRTYDGLKDPAYKKLKLSVSKDPKASDVFKSLFTTHSEAKSDGSAHWVTYNPFYN